MLFDQALADRLSFHTDCVALGGNPHQHQQQLRQADRFQWVVWRCSPSGAGVGRSNLLGSEASPRPRRLLNRQSLETSRASVTGRWILG
jgi:hypothetical protein